MRITALAAVLLAALSVPVSAQRASLTDAQIRRILIDQSIADYKRQSGGPCACPFNVARNGSSCGKRSAYTRPGGYAPLRYAKDITDQMVAAYKTTHLGGQGKTDKGPEPAPKR